MPRTPEAQAAWEQNCFGCSQERSRAGINQHVEHMMGNTNMALGSILSDAQELIERGRQFLDPKSPEYKRACEKHDQARQYLNRVKDALFNAAPIRLWQREED